MKTNLSHEIRTYLAAHPGSKTREIAAQIGRSSNTVYEACFRMTKRGILSAAGPKGDMTYTIAREMKIDRVSPPEVIAANRKARRRSSNAKYRARCAKAQRAAAMARILPADLVSAKCVPAQPAPIIAESVEEWLAKGGRPIVLPTNWERPNYRQLGAGMLY